MPGDSGVTVVTMLVCLFYFACEAAGASCARHSLRPLMFRGGMFSQNSRENPRRDRGVVSRRHCEERSDEAIHLATLPCSGLPRFARNDGPGNRIGCLKIEL